MEHTVQLLNISHVDVVDVSLFLICHLKKLKFNLEGSTRTRSMHSKQLMVEDGRK